MLELGPHVGRIIGHSSCQLAGKDAIRIAVTIEGEATPFNVIIFLTEKAMGMARASLKACGFDCDKQDLAEIDCTPPCLAGNSVPLMAEEYNGKLRLSIDLNQKIQKPRMAALTQALRNVKKRGDGPAPAGKAERPDADYGDIPF